MIGVSYTGRLAAVGLALSLSACATAPRKTVASLDHHDPRYATRPCREARAAAIRYDDNRNGRMVVAVAGNLVVPFAGTAAAAVMGKAKDDERRALDHRVRSSCISDPLGERRADMASR